MVLLFHPLHITIPPPPHHEFTPANQDSTTFIHPSHHSYTIVCFVAHIVITRYSLHPHVLPQARVSDGNARSTRLVCGGQVWNN